MSEADLGSAPADAAPVVAPPIANIDAAVPKTPNSAVDRAMARFEKGETVEDGTAPSKKETTEAKPVTDKAPKVAKEAEPAPTSGDRNADGTFKAKAADTTTTQPAKAAPVAETTKEAPKSQPVASDAPARFASDPEAKAAWATLPEPVKAATSRVIREMEQGVEKYKGDATRYADVFKPFEDLATASRMDAKATLQNYVQIDQLLAKDFGAGIAQIFKNKGVDPREWAGKIMGQTPQPQDQTISELRQQIIRLEQGFQGVHQTLETQRNNGISQSLSGFMSNLSEADQALFTELDTEIAGHLTRDPSTTLQAAFEAAKRDDAERYSRRYGAPPQSAAPAPAEAQTLAPDLTAQTRKAELSIHGAPGSGSDPASRKGPNSNPKKSPDDAVDRAMRAMGLA